MFTFTSAFSPQPLPAKNLSPPHISTTLSLLQTGLPAPLPFGVICQRQVRDLVADSGGVSIIVYLMAISSERDNQRASLRLLHAVLHNHAQNSKEMSDIYGYQLISHLIRKKQWVLDDGLLSILFSFAGIAATRTSIHYTEGVVTDVNALRHFLLEWDVWRRAPLSEQKRLFESLEKLVSALHAQHDFNIAKFRSAGAFETILKICREDDVPLEIVPLLMAILRSISHRAPNRLRDDLQLLVSYLLETTPRGKPSGTGRRRKGSSNSNAYLVAALHASEEAPPPPSHDESVRVSVLSLLVDILAKAETTVIEEFHAICNLESIFGLLANESVTTRILFLRIVDLFLHIPILASQFARMKGFHLLGHQLLSYTLTEELFDMLFCMLLGRPYKSERSSGYLMSQISVDVELRFPGAIVTILIALCNATSRAQHQVVKMIHNIFLQNDTFKQVLLEQELIHRLVDVLASNASKRSAAQFAFAFNRNSSSDPESPAPSTTDSWKAEESILALLKEIALYGAKSQEGTTILRDILVILHLNTKMDFDYMCCLQRRVLFDVISFFSENKFASIDSLKQSTLKSSFNFSNFTPTKSDSSTPTTAPSTPKTPSLRYPGSPEASDLSNNEQSLINLSSNDESTEESDSSFDNHHHHNRKSYVPIWIKEGNLFDIADNADISRVASELWRVVYKDTTPDIQRRAFDAPPNWSTTLGRDVSSRFQATIVEAEAKRFEEKHNQLKSEWKLQYLETQKTRQVTLAKNADITKATKRLSEALLTLRTQFERASIVHQCEHRTSKRFIASCWKSLVRRVTHERAVWESTPSIKWKLDPTEGTNRMRTRQKRITSRSELNAVVIPELDGNRATKEEVVPLHGSTNNLHGSTEYASFDGLTSGEKLNNAFPCSCISPFYQRDGELLIGELNVYFMDELLAVGGGNIKKGARRAGQTGKHITMAYDDIIEIHKRRHVLKNSAIEIFLGAGVPHKTYLFAFAKPADRDTIYDLIMSKPLPNRVDYAAEVQGSVLKMSITKKWQRGMLSNFEYLMHLNTLAGRSFNDLTQYPIFPFILRDYESSTLDLDNPETFRDLSKPMGAQDPQRLKKFIEKYNYLLETNETPYHYGSHYSNVGSVLHFLVRLQPFSSYFIEFQGGRFDVPDRAFHSIVQSWRLSSSISSSDVKELIPEFFYLPDFLVNDNNFNMGIKQDGVKVDNVVLPPWANGDPRLFVKKHLEALECKYVSENLHHWIDLMFGYKQQGDAAVKAHNMFFPLTYEGAVDIDSIEDPLTRDATIAQIHSYGQTPKQLFTKSHPSKNWRKTVTLLQDTIYTRPERLTAYAMWSIRSPVGSIGLSGDTPIPLPFQKTLARLFVTGGTSGTIKVWKRCNSDGALMTRKERGDNLALSAQLYGHTQSILCITASQEFSVIVSGSKDNTAIVWDLNRLTYVMSLMHDHPVTCVQVSPTSNYIATVDTSINGDASTLRLWSPRGQILGVHNVVNDRINCMTFTAGIEGVVTNLLIVGMESGNIILFDSWDLTPLRKLHSKSPITAIAVSRDHSQLIVGDSTGLLECWSTKSFDSYSAIVG
eukprot:gene15258-18064_t